MIHSTPLKRRDRAVSPHLVPSLVRCGGLALACSLLLGACGLFRAEPPLVAESRSAAAEPHASGGATTFAAPAALAPAGDTPVAATAMPKRPLPPPANFEQAVQQVGDQVFHDALDRLGREPRQVVIDPLIDANTGAQTASTVLMGDQLATLLKSDYAALEVKPFTREALAAKPLLVIGTVTPINGAGAKEAVPNLFRIWLTLIDLRTGRVVAKNINRATMESVDPRPLKFYADSPTWTRDRTVAGYIDSCQVNTKVGDLADPIYLEHLPAAAVLHEAITAYGTGDLTQARGLYREAQALADPGDLRVSNGLYLTNWKLGEHEAAKDAFDDIVNFGLETGKLPLKLLFRTGSTGFSQIGDWPEQYELWLASVARQTVSFDACMKVVGHASRTGDPAVNEVLSQRRAETVQVLLERNNGDLKQRLSAAGMGSKELLVGIGTDDLRDALDRRVEFKVIECKQPAAVVAKPAAAAKAG